MYKDLANTNNLEHHIITVGMGLYCVQSMEDLPFYNRQGKLISVKPFVSENAQLGVINIIDRGQSYEQMTQEIKTKVNESVKNMRKHNK